MEYPSNIVVKNDQLNIKKEISQYETEYFSVINLGELILYFTFTLWCYSS